MSARDALLAALAGSPELRPGEAEQRVDALISEVAATRDAEIIGWLGRKAREYRSTRNRQHAEHADVLDKMASKVARGAVRSEAAS